MGSNLGPVAKLESILGPDSAEHPLKPQYKTQNRTKRFNRLDNRNCFGTRGSEVQILSPRPIFSSGYREFSRAFFRATGCNWQFRCHSGHVETESSLLRRESAELNIFLHLRVTVRDALVGVTEPETQQILWHSLLAKMSHTVSPKSMEAALLVAHLSQDFVKAPPQYV